MKLTNLLLGSALLSSTLFAGGDIAPVEPVMPEVVVNDSWNYSAAIYLWGADIGGTTGTGQTVDIPFSDIVDNLDLGFMGHFDARKGKWTVAADAIYLKVGDTVPSPGPIDKLQFRAWIVTPYAAYNVVESDQWNLDLLAGARYLYMKPKFTYSPILPGAPIISGSGTTSVSDSNWDGIIGMKGNYKLNEKWFMPFMFDVGSGDSKMTWQAFAGVGYKYENFDVVAGYRYLEWEFDDVFVGFNEFDLSGPMIGLNFKF